MNFDEIKERILSSFKATWDNFQESETYFQIKDRYENLSPAMQKLTVIGVVAVIVYAFLSLPLSTFQSSKDYVTEYEDRRSLIRDLLKTHRDSQSTPALTASPDASEVQAQIQSKLDAASLLAEQIKGIELTPEKSDLVPESNVSETIKVRLEKLNLKQIVDIGYQIQNINPSVKMKDLVIEANRAAANYFDVAYYLVVLNVPDISSPQGSEK